MVKVAQLNQESWNTEKGTFGSACVYPPPIVQPRQGPRKKNVPLGGGVRHGRGGVGTSSGETRIIPKKGAVLPGGGEGRTHAGDGHKRDDCEHANRWGGEAIYIYVRDSINGGRIIRLVTNGGRNTNVRRQEIEKLPKPVIRRMSYGTAFPNFCTVYHSFSETFVIRGRIIEGVSRLR